MNIKDKCENCKHYKHTPNIIGGITECLLEVKNLNSFWPNAACGKFHQISDNKVDDSLIKKRLDELTQIIDNQ